MKRRALIVISAITAVAAITVAAAVALHSDEDGSTKGPISYPDLQILPPSFLRLTTSRETGKKLLRFETQIWNSGAGPFEVRPENVAEEAETVAYQRLYHVQPSGEATLVRESYIGAFLYHPEHKHWHLSDFAEYTVHAVNQEGGISDEIVADASKVSFCLLDEDEIDLDLPNAPEDKQYTRCKADNIQGISVGWADSYESFLPGQSIDVTDLPDGDYWLVFATDPSDLIEESDEDNNQEHLKINIAGKTVTVLSATPTPTASPSPTAAP